MDGVAYPKGEQEPATVKMVVLNSGDKTNDTELQTVLRRAAAKIVVNIKSGEHVQFDNGPQTYHAGYYLRNMPYSTSVIKPAMMDKDDAELMTPELNNGGYFKWTPSVITVTAYAYAHVWDNASTLEKEVRLIVNIPMNYLPDNATEWKFLDNSYYQIPVSTKKELNRNTCYEVNVTVDAPGGSNPSKPVLLKDISYSVRDWDEERINVGGDTDRPAYLTLNEYEMEMHNMADDNTTLEFASSSEVTATIDRVYYIDKFGQEKELTQITNGSADEWGENIGSDYRPNWKNRCIIKITPDENITGKIQVHGDVPGNNAVRYIIFTVENEEGIKREVKVAQYPLEYITNIQGWYSYRSDFGGTTWENYRDPSQKRVSAYNYDSRNDTWSYSATRYGNDYIFTSKVAEEIETGSNRGKSSISYYYYNRWQTSLSTNEIWNAGNARMYHVQITASSGDYTLGQPRITNGKTDPGEDNAEPVSPSFMIASQLGAVFSISDEEMAASHCREYVEVAQDGTVYDDWRLPTRAELEIIMEFQYKENAAMDEVLAGPSYWSASGLVYNNKGSGTAKTIRCIRDAYDKKTGK